MTLPVDIGEGLVVKGEAAEENLGAGFHFSRITLHFAPLGFIVVRRILTRLLNLGEEGRGGVADGGEDGGVGRHVKIFSIVETFNFVANTIGFDGFVFLFKRALISDLKGFIVTHRRRRLLEFSVTKQIFKLVAQIPEVVRPILLYSIFHSVEATLHLFGVLGNIYVAMLIIRKSRDQGLETIKGIVKFVLIVLKTPINISRLLLNPLHQLPKPLRHRTCAHALPKLPNNFRNFRFVRITNTVDPVEPLEEADDKVQHGVADLILCDISGKNAAAGD
ncbi:uncharacterized protein BcabD6B2_56690 [Babesia caballi]|uniref:Uncharacterized protein n=1 Tax=Babesia caballi TaxID=5871 RepID=A0AAV4M206_BABCB|nr:hypothetical protein, conserved [Babesia caballi]